MAETIKIPKTNTEHTNYPCWVPTVKQTNNKECTEAREKGETLEPIYETIKPHIRCNCGVYLGIGNHHVHADGKVTASFYHRDGKEEHDNKGCGWHVYLELVDWTGQDFPPNPK